MPNRNPEVTTATYTAETAASAINELVGSELFKELPTQQEFNNNTPAAKYTRALYNLLNDSDGER